MSFKQQLPAILAAGLDETYRAEDDDPSGHGRAYFDRHVGVIEEHEMAVPTFRRHLGGGGRRILESGCGTGRWMAYFERLGNQAVGVDDSWGPLRVARAHEPAMKLARANALMTPFKSNSFDAVFSSYVAEHFAEGPEDLFREIHRVLKPEGRFFVVVPFNNVFRRLFVNPALRLLCLLWRVRGRGIAFTEFRYSKHEMDAFLSRTGFEVMEVFPDDFRLPWSKGLFVDLCDVGYFFGYEPRPPYQFGAVGLRLVRLIHRFGPWSCCAGIFYVARAKK
jgi:SAM-dependent methyltransferase